MKKLLIVAMMTLFVASAYAADISFWGFGALEGRWVINNAGGEGDGKTGVPKASDRAYIQQNLQLWARITVDPKTSITFRTWPYSDRILGGRMGINGSSPQTGNAFDWGGYGQNAIFMMDRGWMTYKTLDDKLTLEGGVMTGNNYDTNRFGGGFYELSYRDTRARNQLKATYAINSDISAFVVYQINMEAADYYAPFSADNGQNGRDNEAYLLGAKMSFGDLKINPTLSYSLVPTTVNHTGTGKDQYYGGLVDFAFLPVNGLNARASVAYVGGKNDGGNRFGVADEDYSVYGAYVEAGLAQEAYYAGVYAAYASFDKKSGWFNFGGNFDKASIFDDYIGDTTGVPANTTVGINGYVNLMENKVKVSALAAYFMSNISKNYVLALGRNSHAINEDTNAWEVDLNAAYKWTPATTVGAGVAYAQVNDVQAALVGGGFGPKYDTDPIFKIFWNVTTVF